MKPLVDAIRSRHGDDAKYAPLVGSYKVAAGDSHLITMTANTATLDLEDELVLPSGCELDKDGQPKYFAKSKAVYYNHDYYSTTPVGVLVRASMKSGGWTVQVRLHGKNQLSRELIDLFALGDDCPIRGGSIGFRELGARKPTDEEKAKYGPTLRRVVDRWLWLEHSITPMPCNPDALITDYGAATEKAVIVLDELVSDGVIRPETARTLGWTDDRRGWESPIVLPQDDVIRLDPMVDLG
jgi:hypothetical protein